MSSWLTDPVPDALWLLVIALALGGLALVAYALRALDAPGAAGSFCLGFVVAWLGGLGWLLLLVTFTGLGFVATRTGRRRKEARQVAEANEGERGVRNVLANGLAAGLAAVALHVEGLSRAAAALAFATAVAAVTADTMASELGILARRARRIVPPFPEVRPGENGGVSWPGQAAAFGGALLIALLAVPLTPVPWSLAWVPMLGGFAGCQLDSLLGATLERDVAQDRPLDKQDVNFIASAVPALVVLVVAALLL